MGRDEVNWISLTEVCRSRVEKEFRIRLPKWGTKEWWGVNLGVYSLRHFQGGVQQYSRHLCDWVRTCGE